MSKQYRVEIVIPYFVDEVDTTEEAEAYGEYLANANGHVPHDGIFEVRAIEVDTSGVEIPAKGTGQ